jgi:NADPH:quinone reductase-like Zn-dependent oxidoreductase
MKAAVYERYGPPEVVRIKDVPMPVPKAGELLIESRAATVNSGDARLRAARVPRGMSALVRLTMGVTKPRRPVLGFEVAGRVSEVRMSRVPWNFGGGPVMFRLLRVHLRMGV